MDPRLQIVHSRIKPILPQLLAWIDGYISDCARAARPVRDLPFDRLAGCYSAATLDSARTVIGGPIEKPPLRSFGLEEFGEVERMPISGITYKQTYFIDSAHEHDESLHFHELVHVVQWQAAGSEDFILTYAAGLYAFGYRMSPLEVMAYDLQASFDAGERMDGLEDFIVRATQGIVANPLRAV
jgi:hypothetical protein